MRISMVADGYRIGKFIQDPPLEIMEELARRFPDTKVDYDMNGDKLEVLGFSLRCVAGELVGFMRVISGKTFEWTWDIKDGKTYVFKEGSYQEVEHKVLEPSINFKGIEE